MSRVATLTPEARGVPRFDKEELRRRFDLVDFVAGYVPLQPAGSGRYRACCPFHQERTPSFYVFDTGHYKCFGCGASGDLFRFVQEIEHISFSEAIKKLAGGGSLTPLPPRVIKRPPKTPERTWKQELARSDLRPLVDSPGAIYLANRGIALEIAVAARVKYAASWYKQPSVMFPIMAQDGNVVAVQGRAIRGDAKITKGPKSMGIFATYGALQNGELAQDVAICEAPIDALSLLMLKHIPAIAVCGSDLTSWVPDACRGTVWIATDADKQGDKDWEVWAPLLESKRLTVKRLRPSFKDWNDELRCTSQSLAA